VKAPHHRLQRRRDAFDLASGGETDALECVKRIYYEELAHRLG